MNNVNFVMDGYNNFDEVLKECSVKDFAAIFFKVNKNTNILFLRVGLGENFVHYVNGKLYNYDINPDSTIKELVEYIDNSYHFDDLSLSGEKSYIRVYNDEKDFQLSLMTDNKHHHIYSFSKNELNILKEKVYNSIKNTEDEHEVKNYCDFQDNLNECVLQLMEVLISQNHNDQSLSFVLSTIDTLLRGFPMSEITENDEWIEETITNIDENVSECENNCTYYFNKRNTSIIKKVEITKDEDGTENKNVTYYNNMATLFIPEEDEENDGKYYYNEELSVEEITLPWEFKPSKFERIKKEELTEENGFYKL